MYDELAHMMAHCDMVLPFQEWVCETLTGDFGDQYVVAMDEAETIVGSASQASRVTLKPQVKYHLDGQVRHEKNTWMGTVAYAKCIAGWIHRPPALRHGVQCRRQEETQERRTVLRHLWSLASLPKASL